MTNVGTVVLIGIIYALDACHIALMCSLMTPPELQPLFVYHNDRTWLSWTVPCCIYDIPSVGHDSLGHVNISYMRWMPSILHQRVAL